MSASKIGSSTILAAVCTTRSFIEGIPSGRSPPPSFGIITRTDEETAKCPEPLCPTSVLPLLGRRDFHLLRGHYPSVLARTGSCATPCGLSPPSAFTPQ